jgi:hypothetical protein
MKKLLILLFLILGATQVQAQSTTVSGQVTDAGGQAWNNGTFTFTLVLNPGYPTFSSYTWTGGTLNLTVSGVLNGTGGYSVSIPSNTAISPINSQWSVKFCPQASSVCFTTANTTISGATQTLNATPPVILINLNTATPPVSAYSTTELTGAVIGSQFFLLGTGLQVCSVVSGNNCTTWVSAGGGGLPTGLTFASPTLTVSSAGNGNGCLALSGTTSGAATFCAPAVAGTTTNGVTMSNNLLAPNGTTSLPAYSFANSTTSGLLWNGSTAWQLITSTVGTMFGTSTGVTAQLPFTAPTYSTATNCASAASPAVCGSAAAGSVAVPTGATPTLQINTTAVTANSQITLTVTEAPTTGTRLGVTCNTTLSTLVNPVETLRVAGASFTIQMNSTLAVNPACVHYLIVN